MVTLFGEAEEKLGDFACFRISVLADTDCQFLVLWFGVVEVDCE